MYFLRTQIFVVLIFFKKKSILTIRLIKKIKVMKKIKYILQLYYS
jgi:hypothetical protein